MSTISSLLKDISTARLSKIKKLKVRDFDEQEKNNFVAYVDEGKESHDVQLITSGSQTYISSACDCSAGGICDHQLALALYVTGGTKKEKAPAKTPKKKLSETDRILESVDTTELKTWISEILNKNKDLAILFTSQFNKSTTVPDEEYIKNTIQQCITSVIGRRKTVETNEAKKVADLLNLSLNPILESVLSKHTPDNYQLFKVIISELENFNFKYHISGVKIVRLTESLVDRLVKSLYTIKDNEEWQKAATFYLELIFGQSILHSELNLCKSVYEFSTENKIQRKFLADMVDVIFNKEYQINQKEGFVFDKDIEAFIIKIFSENNLFGKYYNCFSPRKYQNEFNILIIENLITNGHDALAEQYCNEQISANSRQDYNIPYVKMLIDIHKKNAAHEKLATLLSEYGKYSFSIEDYLFIKEHCTKEKFTKYRKGVMTNARGQYQNGNIKAFDFYFELKKLDGKASELFDMLKTCHSFDIVNQYKEIAMTMNAVKFIDMVCSASFFYVSKENILKSIAAYIIDNTEKAKLQIILKNVSLHWRNRVYGILESAIQ